MRPDKYVIGLDFGTLSGRAVLVAVGSGKIIASSVMNYPHGVLDCCLPDGKTTLEKDWYLQCPGDYVEVLCHTVQEVVDQGGVPREDIIALSMDATASTLMPIDKDGRPLCEKEAFAHRPHAYVKLWKHHAAQDEADEINDKLNTGPNDVVRYYGNRISSEIMLPKALQILREDPELYRAMDALLEAPDWLNRQLTGCRKRSINTASYKSMHLNENGYPSSAFFRRIDPGMEHFVEEKLKEEICEIDKPFGKLRPEWAERLHLREGIAVGCSIIDAHACLIGCGITAPGRMMLALGTSSVQSLLSKKPYSGNGIIGAVKDCIVPGYYAWESGLAAVGDLLAWYVEHCASPESWQSGDEPDTRLIRFTEAAAQLRPGESGLLALDWWNGNKTPYVQSDLSGVIVGLRLDTNSTKLFRALIEATAFGTRCILENFLDAGAEVDEIIACGGIAEKNPLLMQIFADVLGREIKTTGCRQTGAMGAAIIASVAAGEEAGGYRSLGEAARHMTFLERHSYRPEMRNHAIYSELYQEYLRMSEYFGQQKLSTFERLKKLSCFSNREE